MDARDHTEEWSHPEVNEAVFDAPPGYEFDSYMRGHRETTVNYRREGAPQRKRLADVGRPDEATPETYPHLIVQMWQGAATRPSNLRRGATNTTTNARRS